VSTVSLNSLDFSNFLTPRNPPIFTPLTNSYQLLWAIFPPNSLAAATHEMSGEKYAFKVKNATCTFTRSSFTALKREVTEKIGIVQIITQTKAYPLI